MIAGLSVRENSNPENWAPIKRLRPDREIPERVRRVAVARIELALLAGNRGECESILDEAFSHAPEQIDRDSHIQQLGLEARTVGDLETAGVETVGQLCAHSFEELLKIRYVGEVIAKEIVGALSRAGLKLREQQL